MIFLILYAILLFNEQKLFNRDKIQLGRDNLSGPITRVEIFPVAPFTRPAWLSIPVKRQWVHVTLLIEYRKTSRKTS